MPQVNASRPGRCLRCFMQPHLCLCDSVEVVQTTIRFLVIRHYKEAYRTTNTVRLAALAMPSMEIHDYGSLDVSFDPSVIPADAWLLFPADGEHPTVRPGIDLVPSCMVVLDGTWRQARRIANRIPQLANLKRFSPPPALTEPRRTRKPPHPGGMATIEAIARAIEVLEGPESAAPLDALFDAMVGGVRQQRGYIYQDLESET
jgi:DTW domain-containing protein YfiP